MGIDITGVKIKATGELQPKTKFLICMKVKVKNQVAAQKRVLMKWKILICSKI